jgi:2'-5' RNA ligase
MKLPNWFKIIWWLILLGLTGVILFKRFDAITSGQSVVADIFVFLLFVALMLVPIFSEIEFFGIKLKRELEELKADIKIKLGDIRNDIRTAQTQTLHATFQGFGPPPPDNKLPELETQIDRIVNEKLQAHGVGIHQGADTQINVPEYNLQLFKVRYNIEAELRRIWEQRFPMDKENFNRHLPIMKIIQDLTKYELLDNNFYGILREILSICNYAIHGEKVTEKQVAFVTKNANQILEYLRGIS